MVVGRALLHLVLPLGATSIQFASEATTNDERLCVAGKSIPHLFVLGAQKAGTTSIAADLFKSGFRSVQEKGFASRHGGPKELHSFDQLCGFRTLGAETKEILYDENGIGSCPKMTWKMKQEWASNFEYECGVSGLLDCTPENFRLVGLPPVLKDIYGESWRKVRFLVVLREPLSRMQAGYYQTAMYNRLYGYQNNTEESAFESLQDYVDQLRNSSRMEGFRDRDWEGVEHDYLMDPIYRSMYSLQLSKWLEAFFANQFTVLPMSRYFQSGWKTRAIIHHIGLTLQVEDNAASVEAAADANHGIPHPSLETDLTAASRQWLSTEVFQPDAQRLSQLLSHALTQGLTLWTYIGDRTPESVHNYLLSSW